MATDRCVGMSLPEVTLESSAGGTLHLPRDLKGNWTLLYFYPKDDTPGCTKQACSYRDNYAQFKDENITVLGVSGDDLKSHDSFIHKFNLNFPLLADTGHALSTPLGVFGDQEWKGKTYRGLSRDTFLIDPNGKIREVWRKVNPESTVKETFDAVMKHKNG